MDTMPSIVGALVSFFYEFSLSVCVSVCLNLNVFVCLTIRLSICQSICPITSPPLFFEYPCLPITHTHTHTHNITHKPDLTSPTDSYFSPSGDLVEMGVKMTVARLGTSLVMELMRLLEGVRGRLTSTDMQSSPQGIEYLQYCIDVDVMMLTIVE